MITSSFGPVWFSVSEEPREMREDREIEDICEQVWVGERDFRIRFLPGHSGLWLMGGEVEYIHPAVYQHCSSSPPSEEPWWQRLRTRAQIRAGHFQFGHLFLGLLACWRIHSSY
ncbi:hypothetical protein Egran_04317 [Elaphomyces granulatus]|uniref:Uncharacterized protein n=1 Tax=Elaphomyces granulatus TaxID=519963 RepID=A0A232LUW7_9EURO|nr:hypothetical protein Egran_04317 [Elaphomyces granulatus]